VYWKSHQSHGFNSGGKVTGLLSEFKRLITVRSQLYQKMLDSLHGDGIEIMSPSIMNQRRLPDNEKVIPDKLLIIYRIVPKNGCQLL
jgi:hypothetical protein